MQKVNMNQNLFNIFGEPIFDGEGENQKQATLGILCIRFLYGPAEQSDKVEQKLLRDNLAHKIFSAMQSDGFVELKSEEIMEIKTVVNRSRVVEFVGIVNRLIEPENKE